MCTDSQLTLAEETTLAELEAIVQRNRWAFIQVGNALAEIRFRRLYRATHPTFESYCRARWGFKRRTAYAYLEATTVATNVHSSAQNPPSLTQARELAVLEPEQQREIAATVDFANTPVRKLKERIARLKGQASPLPEDDNSSDSSGDGMEEAELEPAALSVRPNHLCEMCRQRLFPEHAPPIGAATTPSRIPAEMDCDVECDQQPGYARDAVSAQGTHAVVGKAGWLEGEL